MIPASGLTADGYGMWVVGDQLYVGYGLANTIEELIEICRQMAQCLHTATTLSNTTDLLEFAKNLNYKFIRIKTGALEVSKCVTNQRLRLLLFSAIERANELIPLLVSSAEAHITTGSPAGRMLAQESRDYFKLKILEVMRDLALYLQTARNGKACPEPEIDEVDIFALSIDWINGKDIRDNDRALDHIKECLKLGRQTASLLNPGTDKGEILAICSECEAASEILQHLCNTNVIEKGPLNSKLCTLSNLLAELKDRSVEAVSRKMLNDFMEKDGVVKSLENAALLQHYKPQREIILAEKISEFEKKIDCFVTYMDIMCVLKMIPNIQKLDAIKIIVTQLNGMSRQVISAARLLFSNPYNDVLKDHFTLIKLAWLRKMEHLESLIMTSAEIRTYQKHVDKRSYITQSSISPSRNASIRTSAEQRAADQSTVPVSISSGKEQPTWESADKDLVQAARKTAMIMCRLIYLVRNEGCSKRDLHDSSKDIVRSCEIISKLARELANECSDRDIQRALMKFGERVLTLAVQLKMVCNIKASAVGVNSGCDEDKQATDMLLENAKNLMSSIRDLVHKAGSASITIRIAANQYFWNI